jgi:hypothetical protein
MKNTLVTYAAGSIGGLAMCIVMWAFSHYGVTQILQVNISGSLSPRWIYPHVVTSGLMGLVFLLPVMTSSLLARSFVFALVPTLIQLFIIFPYYLGKGVAGLSLGILTPFVVYIYAFVWAFSSLLIIRLAK